MASSILDTFEMNRSTLLSLAYRITGSIAEAEDIVQDAFIKWSHANHGTIQSPRSWLMTVVTRQAMDHLKSARVQRESYIGPWLPEPFINPDNKTPEVEHELDETITMALLVLLEQLTPGERASFILHDLFHYHFDEIARILNKTGASCRKLASRAREKIDKDALSQTLNKEDYIQIIDAFFEAVKKGDMAGLESLLRENVIMHTDGGGKAAAAVKLLEGLDTVAHFLIKVVSPNLSQTGDEATSISNVWFNGTPGFVLWKDKKPVSAFNFAIKGNKIKSIYALRNPDKLKFFINDASPVVRHKGSA